MGFGALSKWIFVRRFANMGGNMWEINEKNGWSTTPNSTTFFPGHLDDARGFSIILGYVLI